MSIPIVGKLRATRRASVQPRMPDDDPYLEYINPDGPEAAYLIEVLVGALDRVRDEAIIGIDFSDEIDGLIARARGEA